MFTDQVRADHDSKNRAVERRPRPRPAIRTGGTIRRKPAARLRSSCGMGVIMGHSQDYIPITLVATNAATHWFLKVALIGVICLWPLRSSAADGEKALALRQNVVKVWSGQGNTENGFGFIVSAGAGSLYVITADHVAWGTSLRQPDAEAPSIYLAFYADPDPGKKYKARIVKHDKNHDLALLQVQIPPGIKWEKQCLSTIEEAKRSTPVWFIGRDGEWFVPALSGAIDSDRPNADSWLEAEVPGLRPGSSGGPLVSRTGIVGMVDAGSADEARVLAIEYIKNAVQDWGYPWALTTEQDNLGPQPPALVCEAGSAAELNTLGYGYQYGVGGHGQSYPTAVKCYLRACDLDPKLGCAHLGYMYQNAFGVALDYSKAAELYSKTCKAGNPAGCNYLAQCYQSGRCYLPSSGNIKASGVPQDIEKAKQNYTLACNLGDNDACNQLKQMR